MGVPYLFSYLRRRYPSVFQEDKPDGITDVFLDANAMLYQIAEVSKVPEVIAQHLLATADAYASAYRAKVHIYIDGAPHMGKIKEQRSRRFKYDPVTVISTTNTGPGFREGDVPITSDVLWSPAMFSPGTQMMEDIHAYISTHHGTHTYSSYLEPGEGEHKIMDTIRDMPKGSQVAIVGKDADLLLLAMILAEGGYYPYIVRHNDGTSGDPTGYLPDHPLWHIPGTSLRTHILSDIGRASIWDFILAIMPIGNDFLPSVPEMANLYDVMPIVIDTLKSQPMVLHDSRGIRWEGMAMYLRHMGRVLPIPTKGIYSKGAYSSLYYGSVSPFPPVPSALITSWMITVEWIYAYYTGGPTGASRSWQYTASYPPTLYTLSTMEIDSDAISVYRGIAHEQVSPLTPHQALGAVLPPWLWNLLPEDTLSKVSKYPSYYPYAYDLVGDTQVPYIPIIPYDIVSTL